MIQSWIRTPSVPRKIAVDGSIGVGKTTLAQSLAEMLGYQVVKEPVNENPMLEKFYQNPARYGFSMQVYMLTVRSALERSHTYAIECGSIAGAVFDRILAADTCFAEANSLLGNIDPDEYAVYLKLYQTERHGSLYPDILIFLDAPVDKLLERIKERNRACEAKITADYLHTLGECYRRFARAMQRYTTVLWLDWDEFMPPKQVWARAMALYADAEHPRFERTPGSLRPFPEGDGK